MCWRRDRPRAQCALDHFATVVEAVKALGKEPFALVTPDLPGRHKAAGHLSYADASGKSAIFEHLGGKLVIHRGLQYRMMTNSPPYDQQLAINAYWKTVGGVESLPGTARASDRFARMSWNLDAAPKVKAEQVVATKEVLSLKRAISIPLGLSDPKQPNIASTIWRTVSEAKGPFLRVDLQPVELLGRTEQGADRDARQAREAESGGQIQLFSARHPRNSRRRSRWSSSDSEGDAGLSLQKLSGFSRRSRLGEAVASLITNLRKIMVEKIRA